MNVSEITFDRPKDLEATRPPEERGLARDDVRLLLSRGGAEEHYRFRDLPSLLASGDLLVINESATVPAALPAVAEFGEFVVHLSTRYGPQLWLAEPRWSASRPGPLPLRPGARLRVAGVETRVVAPFPGIPRLLFLTFDEALEPTMHEQGRPIRYGYLDRDYPLERYQTVFARSPGSAEMPSAGRPFSFSLLAALREHGIEHAPIVLHTGVSSLEVDGPTLASAPLYPEPFEVPPATATAFARCRQRGGRVVAVGTTVVRALESAWNGERIVAAAGFTRLFVHPGRPPRAFDGLLTGFHDSRSSHLALLCAVAGTAEMHRAYRVAIDSGYLWHEFGDSHLILPYAH
ncbi:MAG TPA: S-adenosylmethionine:tRNA ribosyltransferase-isomerase [Thermoplasmata archaeon]|nr:S-adenosylmethionine:tRNA ribosyltransferase-isomerase [Thermoplasmata archaeon]